MITHYIIQAIFVLVGLLTLLASLFNWDWFFTARNTQFIVANTGRKRKHRTETGPPFLRGTGMPDDCHGRIFFPVSAGDGEVNTIVHLTSTNRYHRTTTSIDNGWFCFISHKKASPGKCFHDLPKMPDYDLICKS